MKRAHAGMDDGARDGKCLETCAAILRRLDKLREMSRSLQTKYYDLRDRFLELRQRYYLIECAWCEKHSRWQRKARAAPGDTSYGICSPCFAAIVKT